MCDKAVNDSLAPLKLISNWFIKNLFLALYADENLYNPF